MLVAVAPEAQGKSVTPITTSEQIVFTSAVLTQDLYCPGVSGILVGAPGVTIDLNGFVIRSDNLGP